MSPNKSTITPEQCEKWIYGPQVSSTNSPYAVGEGIWRELYISCRNYKNKIYKGLDPSFFIDNLDNPDVLFAKVNKILQQSTTILDVLLIHSAFINTLGIIHYENQRDYIKNNEKSKTFTFLENLQTNLNTEYSRLYNETEKILKDKTHINIFVPPSGFLKLINNSYARTKNVVLSEGNNINVVKKYLIVTENAKDTIDAIDERHPISPNVRKCLLDGKRLIPECVKPFERIKNANFKPVVDVLGCYSSLLKQEIKKELGYNMYGTFNAVKYINVITAVDYTTCKDCFSSIQVRNNPIIIRKTRNTYLSQLIEHIYIKAYKPKIIAAKSNAVDDILFAATENIKMGKHDIHYYENAMTFFRTKMNNNHSIFPMYSIQLNSDGQEYFDQTTTFINTELFFENVTDELFTLGVFKPMEEEPDRYELNTEFDIELLDCFRDLPNNKIKNELKQEFTDVFYRIVGNYLIFMRINEQILKEKISRIYLIKQYNLIDFTKNPEKMETKLALCSIYLIEKASATFKKDVIKMMENPEYAKGFKMNRTFKIVKKDFSIYNDDDVVFIQNVIDYIYKNAYTHYMEGTDIPLESDDFKINRNMDSFLQGLSTLKDFNTNKDFKPLTKPLVTPQTSFHLLLNILRKIDLISS